MLSFEEFQSLINSIKEQLDEQSGALISESLLNVVANYQNALNSIEEYKTNLDKLKSDNDELLKVNGRLFQKIGFEEPAEPEGEEIIDNIDEIKIEDIIDEKGELI